MSKKVIAAGHICIDITPVFGTEKRVSNVGELLEPGKLIHMNGVSVHTGGSVANTGLAMKLLGNDVTLLGKVGNDAFGGMVRNILAGYGAGGLVVDENSSTSYSVVLALRGIDRIFLHDPGANDTFTGEDIPEDALKDATLFHFGYPPLMRKMYEDGGAALTSVFRRMKARGIATSLDLAAVDPDSEAGKADWKKILSSVLPFVDFFVPSFGELCYMLARDTFDTLAARGGDMTDALDGERYVKPLADICIGMGCGTVVIKCGTSGMYYKTAVKQRLDAVGSRMGLEAGAWTDREGMQPCFKADTVRSGAGAGDVSIAAFLTAALQGASPEKCVALAAAEGAASVSSYDALGGILPMRELEERILAGWPTL